MEVYFDNSSTTKMYDNVIEEVVTGMKEYYGNPSSLHNLGLKSERKLKECRSVISEIINAEANEVHFNSGGSEGNNLILKGVLKSGSHLITTPFEHASILNTLKKLEEDNVKITFLKIDKDGRVDLEHLKESITKDTALVSIMHVNNEIGTIQDIESIGNIIKSNSSRARFHVDAVQSFGKLKIDVKKMNIDFLSASAHKFHGPKGIGFMYIKENNRLKPMLTGGGQEIGIRSGTENVPGIYGLGEAVRILNKDLDAVISKVNNLKNILKNEIIDNIEDIKINSPEDGVCHILNVSFRGTKGEVLLHYLEQKGIYVSTGSACSSKKKGSYVLNAIGLTNEEINGTIRFSLSDMNTEEEMLEAVKVLKESICDLRSIMKRK